MVAILISMLTDAGFLGAFLETLLMVLLGVLFRRKNWITTEGKQAITVIIWKLAVPCLAFRAFMTDFDRTGFRVGLHVLALASFLYLLLTVLVRLAFLRLGRDTAMVCALFAAVGQVTLFSMPILQSIYAADDTEVMLAINLIAIAFRVMVYIVAFFALSGIHPDRAHLGTSLRTIFLNPIMIAMLAGILIWATQDFLPQVTAENGTCAFLRLDRTLPALFQTVTALSRLVSPLAMLLIGLSLGESNFRQEIKDPLAWLVALLRTVAAPLIALLTVCLAQKAGLIHFGEAQVMALVIAFAGPASATLDLYCMQFGRAELLASKIFFMSTLLCAVSIPLCYFLTKWALTLPIF